MKTADRISEALRGRHLTKAEKKKACPVVHYAFGALMGRVLSRVPVAIAADASGVVVTVNQLGIVVGIAAFGSLYLNLAGKLPATAGARQLTAFALSSAHAYLAVTVGLAALALAGAALALAHARAAAIAAPQ